MKLTFSNRFFGITDKVKDLLFSSEYTEEIFVDFFYDDRIYFQEIYFYYTNHKIVVSRPIKNQIRVFFQMIDLSNMKEICSSSMDFDCENGIINQEPIAEYIVKLIEKYKI